MIPGNGHRESVYCMSFSIPLLYRLEEMRVGGGEEIGVGSRLWKGTGWNLEGWFQNNFLLISYQYYISINLKDDTQVRPRLFTGWIPVDFTVCQWTFIFLPVDTCWLIVLIPGKMAVENDLWQLKLWNSKSASVDFIHRLFFALGCM